MRRGIAVTISVALFGASHAGVATAGLLQEEPPATVPTPAPDPAPPPPKPKPAPKPAPRLTPKPAPVYHAPTPAPTTRQPTYTPPARSAPVTPKRTVKPRAQKRVVKKKKKPVVVAPKPKVKPKAEVKAASVVRVPTASVTPNDGAAARRAAVISGMGFSALLFFVVVTVPATRMRFTAPGRVVMDHQMDLVLTGVAVLMLTGLLFYITGTS